MDDQLNTSLTPYEKVLICNASVFKALHRKRNIHTEENAMKKHITDEKNGLDYTLINGVYLPNLISTETNYEIGVWGQRHLTYIKQN